MATAPETSSSANAGPFGIGVIGTGIMGRKMIAALQQHPRFRVVAAWDPDANALQAALAQASGVRAAAGVDSLVDDAAVQAIYIASPPAWHAGAVSRVLQAGKGCFCEKPLTHDITEAEALREAVLQSRLPFAVNFPFARGTAAGRMRSIVQSGELGPVVSARIHLRFARWPRAWQAGASTWLAGPAEGGFTREVLSHFAFQALRLFGPAAVADVELQREPGQAETALRARWVHREVQVSVDAAVAGEVADDNRFEVQGERGSVALTGWSRLDCRGEVSERVDNTAHTLDGLAALLEGRAEHGLASIDEATAVVRCIETMLRR
ncbi:MAG: Gfo/Idh/MocA family oxidoreductase [Rubrivivax sp.]|nr:Gfo/Idh/MocA family oxidoreductase [Rubrivivax sp.]